MLIFIPWNSSLKCQRLSKHKTHFEFYPAEDAYIEKIYFSNAQLVKKDDLLLKIKSPMIEHKIEQVLKELEQIKLEINKPAGFKENLNRRFVLEERFTKKRE